MTQTAAKGSTNPIHNPSTYLPLFQRTQFRDQIQDTTQHLIRSTESHAAQAIAKYFSQTKPRRQQHVREQIIPVTLSKKEQT